MKNPPPLNMLVCQQLRTISRDTDDLILYPEIGLLHTINAGKNLYLNLSFSNSLI